MANVDAEQNAAPPQQTEGTAPSEFTLSEENLEALLHGVSGNAPSSKPAAAAHSGSAPAPASATQKPSHPDLNTQIEQVEREEPIASLALLKESAPMEAVPPPPFEAAPVAVTPLQATPQAAPQPDVNSKLALISAIKQRRAVTGAATVRPEAPAPETETPTPVATAMSARELQQEEMQAAVEHDAVDADAAVEEEIAPPSEAVSLSLSRSTQVGKAPLPLRPTKVTPEVEPQKALPAKKVWTNGGMVSPSEREPRLADALRTDTARPESAKKVMPKATVAVPVVDAPDASESDDLFATFGSGLPEQIEVKPKNFISSKAGMGVIGGAIAAAALAVYFFTAHGSPKESAAVKAPAPPVEVSSTAPPAAPSSEGKATPSASATNQHTPVAPVTAQAPGAKSTVTAQAGGQPARQIPAGNPQQIPIAQQSVVSQPAATEAPRTAARAFKAPTAARPANSPVVDAAPALAINAATPAGVGLPARIAPPAPPAPAAPQAATPPKQMNVAGAVQALKITRQIVPQYPAVAKAARVQGIVHFRALIGTDGTVKALTTLGGPLPLAQAAAEAVKQWRYKPTIVDGKPIEVTTQIDVAFTL